MKLKLMLYNFFFLCSFFIPVESFFSHSTLTFLMKSGTKREVMFLQFFLAYFLCFGNVALKKHVTTKLRLSGSNNTHEGNVEVYYDGKWRYICDDYWDIRDAKVVCRQIGFTKAILATRG